MFPKRPSLRRRRDSFVSLCSYVRGVVFRPRHYGEYSEAMSTWFSTIVVGPRLPRSLHRKRYAIFITHSRMDEETFVKDKKRGAACEPRLEDPPKEEVSEDMHAAISNSTLRVSLQDRSSANEKFSALDLAILTNGRTASAAPRAFVVRAAARPHQKRASKYRARTTRTLAAALVVLNDALVRIVLGAYLTSRTHNCRTMAVATCYANLRTALTCNPSSPKAKRHWLQCKAW